MKLAYQACDQLGKVVTGTIDAGSTSEAIDVLRGESLYVTTISAANESGAVRNTAKKNGTGRMRHVKKNLMVFTRQLYLLLSTGTPIVQALESLERQMKDPAWVVVVADIRKHIEDGNALSEAMAQHPRIFDPVYCSLIGAGELSGKLSEMLKRLAALTHKQMQVRNAVVGAMIYPCLLIGISFMVMLLMLLFVLPRFEQLFEKLDAAVPPSTQAVMWVSHAVRDNWFILVPVGAISMVGLWGWTRSVSGRRTVDTILLRLPQMGGIIRSFITARLVRLLGILLDSHLPLTDTLALVRQSTRNHHYAKLIENSEEAVIRGEAISSAFANTDLIQPAVYEAMRSGEQTGQMAISLIAIADFMDEENDVIVRSLTSILEPVILVVLGGIVGFMAVSMFMPLFDLTSMGG